MSDTSSLQPITNTKARTVLSADGTVIAYHTMGAGPAVVVVPGALTTANDYAELATALAEKYTVHAMERRGHGQSGPKGPNYNITKDVEDLNAVLKATGAHFVASHSFGGLVSLEAARGNKQITKMALYEPGVSINGSLPIDWAKEYKTMLSQGKELDAFVAFARGMNPALARMPKWWSKFIISMVVRPEERKRRFPLLENNLLEHYEVAHLDSTAHNYQEVAADVLVMYGCKSASATAETMKLLVKELPHATLKAFAKFDHFAPEDKAPREVAAAIAVFFEQA